MTDSLIIGYDKSDKDDSTVLIVGRKKIGQVVDIVNAFQGEEAEAIWNQLIAVKKKEAQADVNQEEQV